MSEQTEINYVDGEVVWVKLGASWWPGEVIGSEKLPPDVLPSFKKPPIAVVKFFQESTYEYVKNNNSIYKYNCSRKDEFIKKGLLMYRSKHAHMEKFPEDVIRAETEVGGDPHILTRDEFQENKPKRDSYAGLFGSASKKTPAGGKGKGKRSSMTPNSSYSTPVKRVMREKSDYKVHILVQGSKTPSQSTETLSTPSTSRAGSETEAAEDKTPKVDKPASTFSTPASSNSGVYPCPLCSFTTTRLNVLILHNKTHSATYTPYTPSPVRKKPLVKSPPKPAPQKTPKARKPRKEKTEKVSKKSQAQKRSTDEPVENVETKKVKTDEEIKSSLLADWDDMDEDSNDKSPELAPASPEVPAQAAEPAEPTPAELPTALVPEPADKPDALPATEKPESSSDSKYEFCEDEDWALEADGGRKIPRVKNPAKRKEERKSISIDEDDVAREVAELLNRTQVPELPSAPEPLTVEENFPEPSIVKSPDKAVIGVPETSKAVEKPVLEAPQPTKAIFKTKTFFRSRHSRSQDAIGKYVAEQLNAERIDTESELNGSEVVSSPEARESPPIEHVKVARLAPKIQLKKMKAEAAQLREKEKTSLEFVAEDKSTANAANITISTTVSDDLVIERVPDAEKENVTKVTTPQPNLDVLYPTQEIKPINKDIQHGPLPRDKFNKIEQEKLDSTINKEIQYEPPAKDMFNNIGQDQLDFPSNKEDIICDKKELPELEKMDEKSYEETNEKSYEETNEKICEETNEKSYEDINEKICEETNEKSYEETNEKSYKEINEKICGETNEKGYEETNEKAKEGTDEKSNEVMDEKSNEESSNLNIVPVSDAQTPCEQLTEPFMNESTASAVDALLSVSREADRVTKTISDDLPEDLFEDDNKDNGESNNVNGFRLECTKEDDHSETRQTPVEPNIEEEPRFEEVPMTESVTEHEDDKISQNNDLSTNNELTHNDQFVNSDEPMTEETNQVDQDVVIETEPSESDLQIAEALINLPATAIQNKVPSQYQENITLATHFAMDSFPEEEIQTANMVEVNDDKVCEASPEVECVVESSTEQLASSKSDSLNPRFETEEEKSENLYAAQSLVEMSESIEHKIKVTEANKAEVDNTSIVDTPDQSKVIETNRSVEQKIASLSSDNNSDPTNSKAVKFETSSSKLLKILEEPCIPKIITKTPTKQVIVTGKEKILNFDVSKAIKGKTQSPKQKIIIRRNTPSKNIINTLNEIGAQENIVLSRTNKPPDGSSVQTYTIQSTPGAPAAPAAPSDAGTIIIQQKMRKITKTAPKLHKLKQQYSLVSPVKESKLETPAADDTFYDINSMPIVLGDDILTPESIDKMPIVMSDGKIITNTATPPKLIKTKHIESDKTVGSQSKQEMKTLLMNPVPEVSKATTPNILSKSAKLRGSKPMLVIDKATGKQKIIMTKAETAVKEIKQAPAKLEPVQQSAGKAGKFIILPTASAPRPNRTQKIVIDPQTGKAHVLVAKAPETQHSVPDNKPVSAKLVPQASDASSPGNTVMIITNAQGAQSRIVLTPEHEKILFPNKQQPKVSQLRTVTHRIAASSAQKSIVTTVGAAKTQTTKIVPKQQKSAIITSKGQLIVGGRITTTAQNIAPMPEIRPKQRLIAAEPKKLVQAVQKTSSEPLIFLQQKSGQVMQLTAAQFEHLQRTGQIIQKTVPEKKVAVQKSIAAPSSEPVAPPPHKKARRPAASPSPAKKAKQEVAIAPAPAPLCAPAPAPLPALAPLAPAATPYADLDNLEELLPSTAIVRPPEPTPAPEPAPPAPLSDGQLLAVPGEHFGGPPGTFYLCVEDNGSLTPIDNRPLVLENNQLVPMGEAAPAPAPERRDILEAALANSDVFHEEPPAFRDLNANVSVHCRVSETSSTLHQPIMTPVEVPSLGEEPQPACSLEAGLAQIGVVPTTLELPITVTDPRIAPRAADPLAPLPDHPPPSISMPLLLDEEPAGKSMPLLTDELSPAGSGSGAGSPGGAAWSRRLLTPCSDSDASLEIPLQPPIQLSASDIATTS